MKIILTKISDDRHQLEIVRDNKERECVELETKSLLLHDLIHYAVESLAGLDDGFWGSLYAGRTLNDLNDRTGKSMKGYSKNLAAIEIIVGAFSSIVKGKAEPKQLLVVMDNIFDAQGKKPPVWLKEELIVKVKERMKQLIGQWNSTPFGGQTELAWPVDK